MTTILILALVSGIQPGSLVICKDDLQARFSRVQRVEGGRARLKGVGWKEVDGLIEWEPAFAYLAGRIKAEPGDVSRRIQEANFLLHFADDEGCRDTAIRDFTAVIGRHPDAYPGRARARFAGGDLAGAEADLDRAIAERPGYPPVYLQRSDVRRARGNRAGAEADLDRVLTLDPTDAPTYLARSALRRRRGDAAGARADRDAAGRLVFAPPRRARPGGAATMKEAR